MIYQSLDNLHRGLSWALNAADKSICNKYGLFSKNNCKEGFSQVNYL